MPLPVHKTAISVHEQAFYDSASEKIYLITGFFRFGDNDLPSIYSFIHFASEINNIESAIQ